MEEEKGQQVLVAVTLGAREAGGGGEEGQGQCPAHHKDLGQFVHYSLTYSGISEAGTRESFGKQAS